MWALQKYICVFIYIYWILFVRSLAEKQKFTREVLFFLSLFSTLLNTCFHPLILDYFIDYNVDFLFWIKKKTSAIKTLKTKRTILNISTGNKFIIASKTWHNLGGIIWFLNLFRYVNGKREVIQYCAATILIV